MSLNPYGINAPIVDIMFTTGADSPSFVANTSASGVPLLNPTNSIFTPLGLLGYGYLKNADGKYRFNQGDNINLLSMGLVMPEGFLLSSSDALSQADMIKIQLLLQSVSTPGDVFKINNFQDQALPFVNYEIPLGQFIEPTKASQTLSPFPLLQDAFSLIFTMFNTGALQLVSMLGVPSLYNGKAFYAPFFVKISHNYPAF